MICSFYQFAWELLILGKPGYHWDVPNSVIDGLGLQAYAVCQVDHSPKSCMPPVRSLFFCGLLISCSEIHAQKGSHNWPTTFKSFLPSWLLSDRFLGKGRHWSIFRGGTRFSENSTICSLSFLDLYAYPACNCTGAKRSCPFQPQWQRGWSSADGDLEVNRKNKIRAQADK